VKKTAYMKGKISEPEKKTVKTKISETFIKA
jgi:hypothetical protein